MRASVASISKKLLSTLFAATLALDLVPAAAFAVDDENSGAAETAHIDMASNESDAYENEPEYVDGSNGSDPTHVISTEPSESEASGEISSPNDGDGGISVPAVTQRINQDMTLQTRTVAQAESTRSFFLAQTLESTRTIPMVSANLPLDTDTITEPEADDSSAPENEGGEDSDESDLPASNIIAADSTVVGSFTTNGITYAVEPGGETVAIVAADYNQLPDAFIENQAIVVPETVTPDGIDYYSVTRIADYAFAGLSVGACFSLRDGEEQTEDNAQTSAASSTPDSSDGASEDVPTGIAVVAIPASVTEIGQDAFTDFSTLQYIVVADNNPAYSSYDGVLYNAHQNCLLFIPEGRQGTVRIAPNAVNFDPEAFSHCPSVEEFIADADSAAFFALENVDMRNLNTESAAGGISSLPEENVTEISGLSMVRAAASKDSATTVYHVPKEVYRWLTYNDKNGKPCYEFVHYDTTYYDPWLSATSFRLIDGYIDSVGIGTQAWTDTTYKVGVSGTIKPTSDVYGDVAETAKVSGVTSAWLVLTDSQGNKTGAPIGSSWVQATGSARQDVYINGAGSFDVTFDANGGTCSQAKIEKVMPYQSVTLPTPTRDGYQFLGWYTEREDGTKVGLGGAAYKPGEATTLYAHWTSAPAASFYANGQIWSVIKVGSSYTSNASVGDRNNYRPYLRASSVRLDSGHVEASGWGTSFWNECTYLVGMEQAGDKAVDGVTSAWMVTTDAQGNATGLALGSSWTQVGDRATMAVYLNGAGSFDVALDANGGTCSQSKISGVMPYQAVTLPDPTRDGYQFIGWYTEKDGGTKVASAGGTIKPSEATTLYAHWTAAPRPTFYSPGAIWRVIKMGSYVSEAEQTGTISATPVLRATSLRLVSGYVEAAGYGTQFWSECTYLVGVSKASENKAVNGVTSAWLVTTDAQGNATGSALGSSWTQVGDRTSAKIYLNGAGSFDVTLDPNGGTCSQSKISGVMPYQAITLPTPTRDGYQFLGWHTEKAGGERIWGNFKPSGATTLYAHWTSAPAPTFHAPGSMYRWLVYYTNTGEHVESAAHGGNARYTPYMRTSTLRLVSGCIETTGYCTQVWTDGTYYVGTNKVSDRVVDGITSAWVVTTDAQGNATGSALGSALMEVSDRSSLDIYLNGAGSVDVTLDPNGGTCSQSKISGVMPYQTLSLPTPTRDGYRFLGWYTEKEGGAVAMRAEGEASTVYAHWDAKSYTVTYNANSTAGISGSTASSTHLYDKAAPLTTNGFTKVGYSFAGWNTEKDGTGNGYADGASVTNLSTGSGVLLYAQWDPNDYTVSFDSNGGSSEMDGETVEATYDAAMPEISVDSATREGYNFAGWWDADDDGATQYYTADGKSANAWDKAENFTLVARWTKGDALPVYLSDDTLKTKNSPIYYWPGHGYVASKDSSDVVEPDDVIVAPPSTDNEHFEFLGYYDDEGKMMIDDEGKLTESAPVLTTSATWFAKWDRVSSKIVFDANYGGWDDQMMTSGTESVDPVEYGKSFASSISEFVAPKRKGHTFLGYYDSAANAEVAEGEEPEGTCWIAVEDGEAVPSSNEWDVYPATVDGAVTLYAAWQLDDCVVILNTDNVDENTEFVVVAGGGTLPGQTWHYDVARPNLPTPADGSFSRNGYTFKGWYYLDGDDKVFVSDSEGDPIPEVWDKEMRTLTIYPDWEKKTYELAFTVECPDVEGLTKPSAPANIESIAYDTPDFELPELSYGAYELEWLTASNEVFVEKHMTDGRFTPRGNLAAQTSAPIVLHAKWTAPDEQHTFTLYTGHPGTGEVLSTETLSYTYGTPVSLANLTPSPSQIDGYEFAGWVQAASAEDAEAMIENKDVTGSIVTSFSGLQTENLFFVAKWSAHELSVTLVTTPTEEGKYFDTVNDVLVDRTIGDASTWSVAYEKAYPDANDTAWKHASKMVYDVELGSFALPEVQRVGYDFTGWEAVDEASEDVIENGVIDPRKQTSDIAHHAVSYRPSFKAATYEIELLGNGLGADEETVEVAYDESFEFPYPTTLANGSVFRCWANVPKLYQPATDKCFTQGQTVSIAPGADGEGLASLVAPGARTITLYAIWEKGYSVDVPIVASLAIDVDTNDVIATKHTLAPTSTNASKTYEIDSLRYEAAYKTIGGVEHAAFEGAQAGEVYLSVYAGLPSKLDDERSLLKYDKVGANGIVSYADSKSASPLLIDLGGTSSRLFGKSELDAVTVENAYGFLPFDTESFLTIRYGLFFPNADTAKKFDFNRGIYAWRLPENDHANANGFSSESVDVAKLTYTVSMKSK